MLGDSLRRRRPPPAKRPERPAPRRAAGRFPWGRWLLAALVVAAVAFGTGYLIATQVLFPRPETAGAGVVVPDLYGRPQAEAERLIEEAGLAVGPVSSLPSADAEAGIVLAQDPVPGQQLRSGAAVAFAVSAGPPEVVVPPVTGLGAATARVLLESAGFQVEQEPIRDYELPEGSVVRTDPPAGATRTLPAVVRLLVAVPPVDTATSPFGGMAWR